MLCRMVENRVPWRLLVTSIHASFPHKYTLHACTYAAPPGVFFYPASRIYCRAGDYMWNPVLIVPDLSWIDISGQGSDATNLWGMLMLRPFSKGSLSGLFVCFLTRNAYEPTLVVQGRLACR